MDSWGRNNFLIYWDMNQKDVIFISGNQNKINNLRKYLGYPIPYRSIELTEIQSLDLEEVVRYKAENAYSVIWSPVLVEDAALECTALWRLPWTFIKFFIEELWLEKLCHLIWDERWAIARTVFDYYDGNRHYSFEGKLEWNIAKEPLWEDGFAWDKIFIPHWSDRTTAQMNTEEYEKFYLAVKPIEQVKLFLIS